MSSRHALSPKTVIIFIEYCDRLNFFYFLGSNEPTSLETLVITVIRYNLDIFSIKKQWGALYLFIADFFATQIKGGAKELVVLL